MTMAIRLEQPGNYEAVERLTFRAFEIMQLPGRTRTDEHFLAHILRDDPAFVPELCFVAEMDGEIVGNIMYSRYTIERPGGTTTDALVFGPVSVKPELHGQGIGSQLIIHSLQRARELGYGAVLITGHPAYYPHFGFVPASRFGITMADGASFDAFMALELTPGYLGITGGTWKLCAAFDVCEHDEAAFLAYQERFAADALGDHLPRKHDG